MSVYFVRNNLLADGVNIPTAFGGTVDPLFPVTNVYNGDPSEPMRWSVNASNLSIDKDTNYIPEGDFEAFTGWIDGDSGTGVSSQSTDQANSPTNSLKLVGGASGIAMRERDVTVKTGNLFTISAYFFQASAGVMSVEVKNLQTGKWLQPGGTWSTQASALSHSAGDSTWTQDTVDGFQTETYTECGDRAEITLNIRAFLGSDITGYIDDIELIPAVNFFGIFGHNLEALLNMQLLAADNSAFTSPTIMVQSATGGVVLVQPSFYGYTATPNYERYKTIKLVGIQNDNPRIGEAVLGYAEPLQSIVIPGSYKTQWISPQVRSVSPSGKQHATKRIDHEPRTIRMDFKHTTYAAQLHMRDEFFHRTGGGVRPIVLIPNADNAAIDKTQVVFGRMSERFEENHRSGTLAGFNSSLVVQEMQVVNWID